MQNTKQVLDGDNKDIFKRKREFYLDEDLVDKIDSIEYGAQVNKIEEIEVNGVPVEPDESKTVKLKIPRVINAVTSDSESDALSAAMGKYLYTLISEGGGGGGGGEYTAGKGISIVGNVISNTLPGAAVSSTAPSNPTKGMIWYDTTNDELKTYDGSQWNVTGKEYNAGEGIAIGQGLDYSAMRGPCDEGFHVPSVDECNFILRASYAYPQTPNYFIKAPSNGYIKFGNAGNYDVGFTLRTRNDQGLNSDEAYLFSYDASDEPHIQPLVIRPKSIGAGVRGFANIPVEADEAWTVLYDGLRGTFYWNEELGLISVYSKENDNWLTLQDKNVGAENVGDNGYYFQWGNNYGFTNASEATSSEKVDASGYAPSTYNEPPINTRYDWSSVRNPDLWGGVTGAVTIDNVISNTGVLSVNGQTGHVTVASPDLSNYLAKNNTTSFTPTGDYNPSTKKYVDDSVSAISVPTNVSDLTNDSNFQTATQVSQAISTAVSSAYKYKGSVASYSNLPASGNTEGDVWNVTDTGMNYAWTGSAWDALGATVDFSNYIAKDNTTAFTPSGDYNPATKKYVDDTVASAKSSGATAPSNPTEGQLWYDTTNDQLKVYDGTNWNVVGDDSADINTKTFYLSSTSDLTNAQAALDWYLAGKNPIVVYSNRAYILISYSQSRLEFKSTGISLNQNLESVTTIWQPYMSFTLSSNTVTSVSVVNFTDGYGILQTDKNYSTPYTPQYNGSPATKKYVDDSVSGAVSKGSTAPYSPVEGQLWYDTTNDILKVYNGTAWVEAGSENNVKIFSIPNIIWFGATITEQGYPETFNTLKEMGLWIAQGFVTDSNHIATDSTHIAILRFKMPGGGYSGHGFYVVVGEEGGTYIDDNNWDIAMLTFQCAPDSGNNGFFGVYFSLSSSSTSITINSSPHSFFQPSNSGTTGQVLTKTSSGYNWQNASGGITNDTTGTTSTISQEWVGTKAEFEALSNYGDKIYNIIE